MGNNLLKDFSDDLKKHRESKNITLEQIAQITKINQKFLSAFENADFNIMPDVYIRAFLKSYAECVGLNPDETVEKFESAKRGKVVNKIEEKVVSDNAGEQSKTPLTEGSDKFSTNKRTEEDSEPNKSKVLLPISIIFLAILFTAIYFIFLKQDSETSVQELPFNEVLKSSIDSEVSAEDTTFVPVDNTLRLKAIGKAFCWIRVVQDGLDTLEYFINENREKNFVAEKYFNVILGNSGGVELFLNDQQLEFGGKSGKVVNCTIDKNGVTINN